MVLNNQRTPLDDWKDECRRIDNKINKEWNAKCDELRRKHNAIVKEVRSINEKRKQEYQQKLRKWERLQLSAEKQYRYFKLHALTDTGTWNDDMIDSKHICVWYVAYLLLKLRIKLGVPGEDFIVQFGVPCGATGTAYDKKVINRSYRIFIAAANLIKQFMDEEDFLNARYEDLIELTHFPVVTDDLINTYYFDDIPEAFAGLVSITMQGKLGNGFHLLVDIGGGTTDLALFCVSNNRGTCIPDVLFVLSFPQGINHILEMTLESSGKSMAELQNDFHRDPFKKIFQSSIQDYKRELRYTGNDVSRILDVHFLSSYKVHGRSLSELHKALQDQPVIYGGGGGTISALRMQIDSFTDVRVINQELLSIKNLINRGISKGEYTILSTSYGLASFEKPYKGIKCTDISVAFKKFLGKRPKPQRHSDYEHGLSDY